MNETLRSANTTVIYVILGIILAFAANQGLAFALSTDMPVVAVESNSMMPTFQKGDILVLQGVLPEELEVGDIIVFSSSGQKVPIVHRIVEINSDNTFQTKGDANAKQLTFEKSIESSQIHGKEVLIIPYVGWIKIGITEYIIPNIIWVILGLVLASFIYIIFKNRKGITKIV
jgi:signal peptidase